MPQNFIVCDRGQTMLLPPDLTDWVPDDHVVWSILGAVDQMDLSAFCGAYRDNGQVRAASTGVPLAAVIADGAGASTLGDSELVRHGLQPVFASVTWLTMRAVELASHETEPAPLNTILPRVHAPVLLIASNRPNERATDQVFRARMRQASLWYLPDVGHTGGLRSHPDAYTTRVTAFLRQALTQL